MQVPITWLAPGRYISRHGNTTRESYLIGFIRYWGLSVQRDRTDVSHYCFVLLVNFIYFLSLYQIVKRIWSCSAWKMRYISSNYYYYYYCWYRKDNLILSTGLIMWIGYRKEIPKLRFRAFALRRRESRWIQKTLLIKVDVRDNAKGIKRSWTKFSAGHWRPSFRNSMEVRDSWLHRRFFDTNFTPTMWWQQPLSNCRYMALV